MNFVENFLKLRKESGITQIEIAKKLGFAKNTVSAWEKGRAQPNIETLIKLAEIFEVSVGYLIGAEDDFGNVTVTNSERDNLSYLEKRLLSAFSKLDVDEKDKIISDVEYFAVKHGYIAPTKYAKY